MFYALEQSQKSKGISILNKIINSRVKYPLILILKWSRENQIQSQGTFKSAVCNLFFNLLKKNIIFKFSNRNKEWTRTQRQATQWPWRPSPSCRRSLLLQARGAAPGILVNTRDHEWAGHRPSSTTPSRSHWLSFSAPLRGYWTARC